MLRARENSDTALNDLCATYREPLLTWLRADGHSFHDAEDLVQGFLAHMSDRDFLRKVGPENGCFRAFLLRCLKNFVSDQRKKRQAAKRGGGRVLESLDEADPEGQAARAPAAPGAAPDEEYHKAWGRALLARVLQQLEREGEGQGRLALCRELEPVLFADETASSHRQIALKLGMTESAVKSAAHRIRARLKTLVREEVKQTVTNAKDWREELRYLMRLFQ